MHLFKSSIFKFVGLTLFLIGQTQTFNVTNIDDNPVVEIANMEDPDYGDAVGYAMENQLLINFTDTNIVAIPEFYHRKRDGSSSQAITQYMLAWYDTKWSDYEPASCCEMSPTYYTDSTKDLTFGIDVKWSKNIPWTIIDQTLIKCLGVKNLSQRLLVNGIKEVTWKKNLLAQVYAKHKYFRTTYKKRSCYGTKCNKEWQNSFNVTVLIGGSDYLELTTSIGGGNVDCTYLSTCSATPTAPS